MTDEGVAVCNPHSADSAANELLPEALAVLGGFEECLDHLGAYEVAAVVVELAEPEAEAVEVALLLGRVVGVAAQVAEVLHQHERARALLLLKLRVVCDGPERRGA